MRSAFLGGFASAFTGLSLGVGAVRGAMGRGLGLMVEANAKKGMQGNLQGATNKARAVDTPADVHQQQGRRRR
jgi:hypothetical protein